MPPASAPGQQRQHNVGRARRAARSGSFVTATTRPAPRWRSAASTVSGVAPGGRDRDDELVGRRRRAELRPTPTRPPRRCRRLGRSEQAASAAKRELPMPDEEHATLGDGADGFERAVAAAVGVEDARRASPAPPARRRGTRRSAWLTRRPRGRAAARPGLRDRFPLRQERLRVRELVGRLLELERPEQRSGREPSASVTPRETRLGVRLEERFQHAAADSSRALRLLSRRAQSGTWSIERSIDATSRSGESSARRSSSGRVGSPSKSITLYRRPARAGSVRRGNRRGRGSASRRPRRLAKPGETRRAAAPAVSAGGKPCDRVDLTLGVPSGGRARSSATPIASRARRARRGARRSASRPRSPRR